MMIKKIASLKLVLFFFLATLLYSCQQTVEWEQLDPNSEPEWALYNGKPYTGKVVVSFDDSDNIAAMLNYQNGRPHGEQVIYYEDGQVKSKINFKAGFEHGEGVDYYENGRVREQKNYKGGELHGEWIRYYENGQIRSSRNYKDGQITGDLIEYYQDGQIKDIVNYELRDMLLDLEDGVMEVHNEVMPLITDLRGMVNKLNDHLKERGGEIDVAAREEIQDLVNKLERADEAFFEWRGEWADIDRDKLSPEAAKEYFNKELDRINQVGDSIRRSLKNAKSYIDENRIDLNNYN